MFRYFTSTGTRRWIDVLPRLIESYNNTLHSAIKMKPVDVREADPQRVFENLYGFSDEREYLLAKPEEKNKFVRGDNVRLRYQLTGMEKSFYPTFTDQIYKVEKVVPKYPRYMYILTDFEGKRINRKFYAEDLFKVTGDPQYRIEKILRRRKRAGIEEVFVKFLNYPPSANAWIPMTDIGNVA